MNWLCFSIDCSQVKTFTILIPVRMVQCSLPLFIVGFLTNCLIAIFILSPDHVRCFLVFQNAMRNLDIVPRLHFWVYVASRLILCKLFEIVPHYKEMLVTCKSRART